MRTCAPITAYGPMLTDAASSAFESTMAVGWTCAIGSGHLAHRAHQLGLGSEFLADQRAAHQQERIAVRQLLENLVDVHISGARPPEATDAPPRGAASDASLGVVSYYVDFFSSARTRSRSSCRWRSVAAFFSHAALSSK